MGEIDSMHMLEENNRQGLMLEEWEGGLGLSQGGKIGNGWKDLLGSVTPEEK